LLPSLRKLSVTDLKKKNWKKYLLCLILMIFGIRSLYQK
jgi:hypothetical protein